MQTIFNMAAVRHFHFCRATLCVSAVFAVARRPSVRLSVTLVHSIQTDENIVTLLCRSGRHIILVFLTPGADTQFQGEPLQRVRKIQGVGKFCHFRLKSPSISEMVRDRSMVSIQIQDG